jgi:hypothetical protein
MTDGPWRLKDPKYSTDMSGGYTILLTRLFGLPVADSDPMSKAMSTLWLPDQRCKWKVLPTSSAGNRSVSRTQHTIERL